MASQWADTHTFRLFRGQTTDLWHEIEVLEKSIDHVPDSRQKQCEHWLEHARACLSGSRFGYSKFDEARSSLHEIRHIFCRGLPADELERSAENIAADLVYLTDEQKRKRHEADIEQAQKELHGFIQRASTDKKKLQALRIDLARLSVIGANARMTRWHRVNLLRARLMITAIVLSALAALLVIALLYRPDWFGITVTQAHTVVGASSGSAQSAGC